MISLAPAPLAVQPTLCRCAVGIPFHDAPTVRGGCCGPYVWRLVSGAMPPGIEIQLDGYGWPTGFAGTPTRSGQYVAELRVIDAPPHVSSGRSTTKHRN